MEMADPLDDVCSPEDLKGFEKVYNEELCKGEVSSKAQFNYACFLVRSKYPADIQRGVVLLEELYKHPDEIGKRDYVYYLAIGNARLKEYQIALKYLKGLLRVEPSNRQVLELEASIKKRMENEALKGAAIAGGAVLGLGVLVGLGVALSKRN
ncbi:mitochondrial fission 1 protein-like [Homarus americanus]|uniref:Mitochondrial fission 1 protein n=1 Tax=Homarus americanus TaxID=6706 RepID=A0A8J5N7A0_HOMAM|nr:mitochondrial fission 1 protein-like [Homarus americanus]KAG7174409.1 Mitochondrial fission 1 protein-like [Homarus americanus]